MSCWSQWVGNVPIKVGFSAYTVQKASIWLLVEGKPGAGPRISTKRMPVGRQVGGWVGGQ